MPELEQLIYRVKHGQNVTYPDVTERGDLRCPVCGHDDLSLWAEDGEADLADWWDCQKYGGGCGADGALVQADDPTKTQNGMEAT
jgi:hypothetical protein